MFGCARWAIGNMWGNEGRGNRNAPEFAFIERWMLNVQIPIFNVQHPTLNFQRSTGAQFVPKLRNFLRCAVRPNDVLYTDGSTGVIDTDEALVYRAQQQDRAAFEELVRRTARLLYCAPVSGDPRFPSDGRSRAGNIPARLGSIRQMTHPRGFRPWLLTIANSVRIDAARKTAQRSELSLSRPRMRRHCELQRPPKSSP